MSKELNGVNALKGATLISTGLKGDYARKCFICVNALKGATLISTQRSNFTA